jgi:hypothetical protein
VSSRGREGRHGGRGVNHSSAVFTVEAREAGRIVEAIEVEIQRTREGEGTGVYVIASGIKNSHVYVGCDGYYTVGKELLTKALSTTAAHAP